MSGCRRQHGSGYRWNDGLGQQLAEDVVRGRAVRLPERIESRQIGGLRDADVGGRRVDLFHRGPDGGIVIERVLERLLQREGLAVRSAPPAPARRDSSTRQGNRARQSWSDAIDSSADSVEWLIVLEHFAEELLHARPGLDEGFAAGRCRTVHPTTPVVLSGARTQQTLPFHAVQNRIQRAGAEPVPMPPQLIDHLLTEDRPSGGVMEQGGAGSGRCTDSSLPSNFDI